MTSLPILVIRSRDPIIDVRIACTEAWSSLVGLVSISDVFESFAYLMSDVDDDVRNWMSFSLRYWLQETKDVRLADLLSQAVDDPCDEVQYEVMQGLAVIGDRRARPLIDHFLDRAVNALNGDFVEIGYLEVLEATRNVPDRAWLARLQRLTVQPRLKHIQDQAIAACQG